MQISGETAVVTGGASGIGAAAARALAARGAQVMVVDVDDSGAQAIADEIGGIAVSFDVGEPAEWRRIEKEAPTIAFLNAGIGYPEVDLGSFADADYERIRRVNLDGVVWGVRAVVPGMRKAGRGAIVVTGSGASLGPHPTDPFYTLTKHAVLGLVRWMAIGLHKDGINAHCVLPGAVNTPLGVSQLDNIRRAMGGADPQLLEPDAVADVVVELVEDETTGRVVRVAAGAPPFDVPPLGR